MCSHCSRFHPNRFTFGGVIAERVNTVQYSLSGEYKILSNYCNHSLDSLVVMCGFHSEVRVILDDAIGGVLGIVCHAARKNYYVIVGYTTYSLVRID